MVIIACSMLVQRLLAMLMFLLCSWHSSGSGLTTPELGDSFEVNALISVKALVKDPQDALGNWDKDAVDPCSWKMVTCSSENLVISLESPSLNLSGSLSPGIGNLTNLDTVLLQDNNISGNIPSEIGNLSRLRILDLSNNHFLWANPCLV